MSRICVHQWSVVAVNESNGKSNGRPIAVHYLTCIRCPKKMRQTFVRARGSKK